MKLVKLPNIQIRKKSKDVPIPLTQEDEDLVRGLIEHIDESQKEESDLRAGVGIAAIQCGFEKRMFYVNVPETEEENGFREFLINPKLIGESPYYAALEDGEGCLSVDEESKKTSGLVHRKYKVVVEGYSYFQKKIVRISKSGYPAIVLQHELDHLDGKLFFDRINLKEPFKKKEKEILI